MGEKTLKVTRAHHLHNQTSVWEGIATSAKTEESHGKLVSHIHRHNLRPTYDRPTINRRYQRPSRTDERDYTKHLGARGKPLLRLFAEYRLTAVIQFRHPSPSTATTPTVAATTAIMGKVHGSLARAGKVKSQTPKVRPIRSFRRPCIAESKMACRSSRKRSQRRPRAGPRRESCLFSRPRIRRARVWLTVGTTRYTRRFVNITMTGGKRKMNPNPGT